MGVDEGHLAAARLWAVTQEPYLATALFALSPISLPGLGTLATDRYWRLYVDPAIAAQWSVQELGSVLVHEAHHLLRAHLDRASALGVTPDSFRRFNVAADCEINDDLSELALPAGGVHPAMFGFPTGELAEAYFILLNSAGDLAGVDCGSGAHGVARPWDVAAADERGVGEAEADLIRQQTAVEIRASVQAGGHVPTGLERWARAYLNPVIDWRRELAALVRSGIDIVSGSVDYSYRRPSRRAGTPIGRAVILPALVQAVPRAAVVVDTSGSMSEQALKEPSPRSRASCSRTLAGHVSASSHATPPSTRPKGSSPPRKSRSPAGRHRHGSRHRCRARSSANPRARRRHHGRLHTVASKASARSDSCRLDR
jgi:hypothetical protein